MQYDEVPVSYLLTDMPSLGLGFFPNFILMLNKLFFSLIH